MFTVKYVSGSWTVDYRNFPYVGPGGYSNQEDAKIYQDCKFDANRNYGVLFGDVGETPNGSFAIGGGGTFIAVAPSAYVNGGGSGGYLYLRINDTCRGKRGNADQCAIAGAAVRTDFTGSVRVSEQASRRRSYSCRVWPIPPRGDLWNTPAHDLLRADARHRAASKVMRTA
jgi:hypothetical protein